MERVLKNGCTATTFVLLLALVVFSVFVLFTDDGRFIDLDLCNNPDIDGGSYFYENEFECESIDILVLFFLPAWCLIFVVWLVTRFLSRYKDQVKE